MAQQVRKIKNILDQLRWISVVWYDDQLDTRGRKKEGGLYESTEDRAHGAALNHKSNFFFFFSLGCVSFPANTKKIVKKNEFFIWLFYIFLKIIIKIS